VLEQYEFHPESKCADSDGYSCNKETVGLLQRRNIKIREIKYIGKESNSLDEVDAGAVHSSENVYAEYPDAQREWKTKILPAAKKLRLIFLEKECRKRLSRRALIDLRAGRSRPQRKTRELLVKILKKLEYI
jgi:hypothetical protein